MALRSLPIPYGMPWQDWADTVRWLNPAIREAVPLDATDWREWAIRLRQVETRTPLPDQFAQWEDWAAATKWAYGA